MATKVEGAGGKKHKITGSVLSLTPGENHLEKSGCFGRRTVHLLQLEKGCRPKEVMPATLGPVMEPKREQHSSGNENSAPCEEKYHTCAEMVSTESQVLSHSNCKCSLVNI